MNLDGNNPDPAWGALGTCDQCDTEDIPVRPSRDPYMEEVYPEDDNPESDWCENCWCNACGDI